MSAVEELGRLAERQYGVVCREQAHGLGLSKAAIASEVRQGRWVALTPMVLRRTGAPPTFRQRAFAAVLDGGAGAVLSHHSAAALWEIPGYRLDDLHVTRPRDGSRRPSRLAKFHQPLKLPATHVAVCAGIPVTTPARTVFDLAALVHRYRLERTLDNAWSRRLLDGMQMARVLDVLAKRGRTGTVAIRELLAERGPDYIPDDTGLEARFEDVLRRGAEPPMRRQVNVGGEEWIGRIDFVDPELPVLVQIDSSRFHGSLLDIERDRQQTAALEDAGFAVVRLSDFHVWYDTEHVLTEVRSARSRVRKARQGAPFAHQKQGGQGGGAAA
jgi:very-short-patch-repair endonuclease